MLDWITGGVGSLLGSAVSGIASIFGGSNTNKANQAMVQQQEQFQQMMSNTAYTRAVADMKNAGLNPAMMFGSGGAASTPSGAIAPQTSGLAGAGQALQTGISNAVQANTLNKTIDKMSEEIVNLKATEALTRQKTLTETEGTRETAAKADTATSESVVAALQRVLALKGIDLYSTSAGDKLAKGAMIGGDVSKMVSPIGSIVGAGSSALNSYWRSRKAIDDLNFR